MGNIQYTEAQIEELLSFLPRAVDLQSLKEPKSKAELIRAFKTILEKGTVDLGAGGGGNYIGASPANFSIGDLPAGTVLTGKTLSQILEMMLVGYLEPGFSSFTSDYFATHETGFDLSQIVNQNVNYVVSQAGNIKSQPPDVGQITHSLPVILTFPNFQLLAAGFFNIGNLFSSFTTSNSPVDYNIFIQGTDSNNNIFNASGLIRFSHKIFHGPASVAPSNSAQVRALPSNRFVSEGNILTLNTGNTERIFIIAIPNTKNLVSVIDLDALNANITTSYILNTFSVNNEGGTPIPYKIFIMTNATPYSSNHRHQITLS